MFLQENSSKLKVFNEIEVISSRQNLYVLSFIVKRHNKTLNVKSVAAMDKVWLRNLAKIKITCQNGAKLSHFLNKMGVVNDF